MNKVCTKCKEEKSFKDFSKCPRNKSGIDSVCKLCKNTFARLYFKTKKGLAVKIYDNQVQHSKTRNHKSPSYTKEEFYSWILSSKEYNKLHEDWVKSGFNKKLTPSCDRKDDYKGYSFNNIQLMTWDDNREKGRVDMLNGTNRKMNKAVIQMDLNGSFINEFYSISQAKRSIPSAIKIGEVCNGNRNKTGGFRCKFANIK